MTKEETIKKQIEKELLNFIFDFRHAPPSDLQGHAFKKAEKFHSQFIEPLEKNKQEMQKHVYRLLERQQKRRIEWQTLEKENQELKKQLKQYLPKAWQETSEE